MSVSAKNREVIFETKLDVDKIKFLADHRWRGIATEARTYGPAVSQSGVVVPGTAYLDMALAAAVEVFEERPVKLQDVEFHQALFLSDEGVRSVFMRLNFLGNTAAKFEIDSAQPGEDPGPLGMTKHVSGKISLVSEKDVDDMAIPSLADVRSRCKQHVTKTEHDATFRNRGFDYGPRFKVVEQLWRGSDEAIGEVKLDPDLQKEASNYYMHPGVLDSCFQVGGSALPLSVQHEAFIPVAVESYQLFSRPTSHMWSHVYQVPDLSTDKNFIIVGVTIYNESGGLVAVVPRLRVKRIERNVSSKIDARYSDALYQVHWKREKGCLDAVAEVREGSETWIIFADKSGVGAGVAEQLTGARGNRAILIYAGDKLELSGSSRFSIVPGNEEHMQAVFDQITKDAAPISKIVYLWGLDSDINQLENEGLDDPVSETGVDTIVQLIHTLNRYRSVSVPSLWLVTREAQDIDNKSRVSLTQYPLWGLGRAVAHEVPAIWGGLLDLDSSDVFSNAETVYREILNTGMENQIAIRNGERYVARLHRTATGRTPFRNYQLDPYGTYMITGGLGALGRQLLKWLVKRGARHLVIVTRTQLPGDANPQEVSEGSEQHRKLNAIKSLVDSGIKVHLMVGDVKDKCKLEEIFKIVRDRFPPLKGIFHAAGVLDDGALSFMNRQRLANVMIPKITGAWNLHKLSLDCELELFVMFSSIASVFGSPGQANYCAANSFLDGLAHYRHSLGLPATSINWGPWAGEGMAESANLSEFAGFGLKALDPNDDWPLLDSALGMRDAQVTIAHIDWKKFANSKVAIPVTRFVEELTKGTPRLDAGSQREEPVDRCIPSNRPTKTGRTSLDRRPEQFISLVKNEVLVVLGLSEDQQLEIKEPLLNYGFESLMALRLKNSLENRLSCQLPDTLVFDYPSIEKIADYLSNLLPSEEMGSLPKHEEYPVDRDKDIKEIFTILAEVENMHDDDMVARI